MTPEVETASELRKTGHRWIDISVAGCALVISVTSLCVAIMHGRAMERMADANARLVEANSWPALQQYWSNVGRKGDYVVSLNVSNNGVGPAKVESVELFYKGQPMRSTEELINACCLAVAGPGGSPAAAPLSANEDLPPHLFGALEHSSLEGSILRAGENRRIYELRRTEADVKLFEMFDDIRGQVRMRACYCSVFDECWVSDLRTLHPQRVKECAAPAVRFSH